MPDLPPSQKPPEQERSTKGGLPGASRRRGWLRVRPWMRSDLLHEWVRTGGILIAAAWAVYTFVWKDILVPAWQPAHLNLDASLTPVAGRAAGADGIEMTLEVKASNTSTRSVYLLANYWLLAGIERPIQGRSKLLSDQAFINQADGVLRRPALVHVERSVDSQPGSLLATGRLFSDDVIQPGATVSRTILVRIPPRYGAVELRALVPVLTRQPNDGLFNGKTLAWGMGETKEPTLKLCPPAGTSPGRQDPECPAFDLVAADDVLEKFDPQHSTIVLSKQIGLPLRLEPSLPTGP